MKALCFVREAEQMGRTSLHCVCKAVTEEYNGSFIFLWKHGTEVHRIYTYTMSVKRGRTKYNRAETKQSRPEHSHPVVGWFLGHAPEHLISTESTAFLEMKTLMSLGFCSV